jgi:DNA-directed RNA polymerase specialized sigma24 family protein
MTFTCATCGEDFPEVNIGWVDERPYCWRCYGAAERDLLARREETDRAAEREAEAEDLDDAILSVRTSRALELHNSGLSIRAIAVEMDLSKDSAHRLLKRALRRTRRGQPL